MIKAHRYIITKALEAGHKVNIFDTEEWHRDCDLQEAIAACEAVEEGSISIRDRNSGERLGVFVFVFDFDQQPDEIIADYGVNDYTEQLMADYAAHCNA